MRPAHQARQRTKASDVLSSRRTRTAIRCHRATPPSLTFLAFEMSLCKGKRKSPRGLSSSAQSTRKTGLKTWNLPLLFCRRRSCWSAPTQLLIHARQRSKGQSRTLKVSERCQPWLMLPSPLTVAANVEMAPLAHGLDHWHSRS